LSSIEKRIALMIEAEGTRRAAREVDATAASTHHLGEETDKVAKKSSRADRAAKKLSGTLRSMGTAMKYGIIGAAGLAVAIGVDSVRGFKDHL